MTDWFFQALRSHPEIAIFVSLALGHYFGSFTYRGFGLGSVTTTLIAAIVIGQIGITIPGSLKSIFFLMFLFAIGYGVGPQFVRGIAQDGIPHAAFAFVVSVFCLTTVYLIAKFAGYNAGHAAGLYAGSLTSSASIGLAADAISNLSLPDEMTAGLQNAVSIAFAVTYIFGTAGSAAILALLGPALLGIDLKKACKDYERHHEGARIAGGTGTAWYQFELRAFLVSKDGLVVGKSVREAEAMLLDQRVFALRLRQDGEILEATTETVIHAGDILAVAGRRDILVNLIGGKAEEIDDPELLAVPIEGVDVYVTSKDVDGKTLAELASLPEVRGVFLRKITRGVAAIDIPILADTKLNRGDIVRIVGRTPEIAVATRMLGRPDHATEVTDIAFVGAAISLGALMGTLVYNAGGVPLTLSTSGGVLISGLLFGWLRSIRPTFGRIPSPTIRFMNSIGLSVFTSVIGISAGPDFISGFQQFGLSLFLWGALATTLPLIFAMYLGKYVFRFDDAILLGCCAGARTTTASLSLINEQAESHIPGLGYTITYAVSSTLLTIGGMALVVLMTR